METNVYYNDCVFSEFSSEKGTDEMEENEKNQIKL